MNKIFRIIAIKKETRPMGYYYQVPVDTLMIEYFIKHELKDEEKNRVFKFFESFGINFENYDYEVDFIKEQQLEKQNCRIYYTTTKVDNDISQWLTEDSLNEIYSIWKKNSDVIFKKLGF